MRTLERKRTSEGLFPAFFDDVFTKNLFNWSTLNQPDLFTVPAVNIREQDDQFVIDLAAPGLTKADFRIEMENGKLEISAQKEIVNKSSEKGSVFTQQEFNFGSFKRAFHFDEELIQRDSISAKYENGILTIEIPKAEEARAIQPRRIEIS